MKGTCSNQKNSDGGVRQAFETKVVSDEPEEADCNWIIDTGASEHSLEWIKSIKSTPHPH